MTVNSVHNVVESISNDVQSQIVQNIKTVECRLEETYGRLAESEALVELFSKLIKHNLATNDVKNFVQKQSIHKRVYSGPDPKVRKAAMKSKLLDAIANSRRLRIDRDTLKRRLAKKYASRKSLCRRIQEDLVKKYRMIKNEKLLANENKFSHIQQKSLLSRSMKSAPPETAELLSDVNIFSQVQNSVVPEPSLGPFICDPKIKLSENELKLLAKGPKFMVRGELDPEVFEVNLEKMIAKNKYDSIFNDIEDDCAIRQTVGGSEISASDRQTKPSADTSKINFESFIDAGKSGENVNEIWEQNCGRMVYNIESKSFNFGNMQATAYKHNRDVFMPPPREL